MQDPIIGIIGGKGRMGQLFDIFFSEQGVKTLISDKKTKLTNKELSEKSDIIIISVPIDKTEKVIKETLPFIRKESAIMDFTSVKEMPIKTMLKGKCEVMGMHPMFGNSNPIPGQTVILCHTKKSGKWSKWMEDFLKKHKVKIQKLTAKDHDKIMSTAQGLIHFADITFADSIRRAGINTKNLFKYTSKASELKVQLAARIIDQDPGLYANIQIQNPQTLKALKKHEKSIKDLIKIVKQKNVPAFKKYFLKNTEFFKNYIKEAYEDSSYLIDKFIEKQRKTAHSKKIRQKPGKLDIAVLGPKNTFSDISADKYLQQTKQKKEKYFTKNIDEIFELVEKGSVSLGIVPIENKLNGTVRETLDALFSKKIRIIDEINSPIHHSLLMTAHAKKTDIKTMISHSQALGQCKKYIKKNFPKASLEAYSSTAAAVQKLANSNDKSVAVIAPEKAAKESGLKVFKINIEDKKDNTTTFIIIKKGESKIYPRKANKKVVQKHRLHSILTKIHQEVCLPFLKILRTQK